MSNIKRDYRFYYDIISTIGESEFSKVYKAKLKGKEEYVAIKIINKEKIKFECIKLDIENEFNKINELLINEVNNMKICGNNNKNSVQIYQYFENNKEFIIVMELCDENLMTFLKRKRETIGINEIYNILIQLNNTFKIMSKHNIIHRNLKLENILIKYENSEKTKYIVKITDYGVSKKIDFFSKGFTSIVDSFYCTAPEIIKREKYDYKCDLWSLGIIIKMIYLEIKERNKNKNIKENNNQVYYDFENLMKGLLSKDPKNRLTWEEYFNHPFFNNVFNNEEKKESFKKIRKDKSNNFNEENVDINKYEKDYNEKDFWIKIKKYAIKIGAKPIYIALLLFYALPDSSLIDKTIIIGALGYLISPFDLIPDCIPVIGFMDDISVLLLAFYRIQANINDEVKKKAKNKFKSFFDNFTDETIEKLID